MISTPPIPVDYVEPPLRPLLGACDFYHTMELPEHGTQQGQWDLRGRLIEYLGGVALSGKRCLDIGAASGFLSFEMEHAGAEVVSFDMDHPARVEFLPIHDHLYTTDYPVWIEQQVNWLRRLHSSYRFAYHAHESCTRVYHGDVYQLPDFLGHFDVVVLGQILVHLGNPISALAQAARRCRETLIIVEGTQKDATSTTAEFHARAARGGPPYIWWQLSIPLYRELLDMLNFELVSVATRSYPVRHEYVSGMVPVTTMVARRRSG